MVAAAGFPCVAALPGKGFRIWWTRIWWELLLPQNAHFLPSKHPPTTFFHHPAQSYQCQPVLGWDAELSVKHMPSCQPTKIGKMLYGTFVMWHGDSCALHKNRLTFHWMNLQLFGEESNGLF